MTNRGETNFDDEEFRRAFPAEMTEQEIEKAKEWELFFENADFIQSMDQNIKKRREMLLLALTFLDINTKNEQIKSDAKFDSLYKFYGNKLLAIKEKQKTTFSVEDKTIVNLFKALLELKYENFNNDATVYEVIEALDEKYKAIQNLKS